MMRRYKPRSRRLCGEAPGAGESKNKGYGSTDVTTVDGLAVDRIHQVDGGVDCHAGVALGA